MPKKPRTSPDKINPYGADSRAQTIARALATRAPSTGGASLAERLSPAPTLPDGVGETIARSSTTSQAIERALRTITEPPDTAAITRAIIGHPPKTEIDAILEKITRGQDAITDLLNGHDGFTNERIAAIAAPHARITPTALTTARAAAPGSVHTSALAPTAHRIGSAADIGALVRAARRQLGVTQQGFADLAGVGRRFVSELESGKPSLEFDKVLKCCAAAGIDVAARARGTS